MTTAQMTSPMTDPMTSRMTGLLSTRSTTPQETALKMTRSLLTGSRAQDALMNFPSKNRFFDGALTGKFLRSFVNQALRILPITSPAASYEYLINGYRRMAEQHSVQGRPEMAQVHTECAAALEKVMYQVGKKRAGQP